MAVIALVVRYVVQPDAADAVEDALGRMAELVKQTEPSCLAWQAARSAEQPNVFHLFEVYRDQAAVDEHRLTPHFDSIIVREVRPWAVERWATQCDRVTGGGRGW